MQASKKTIYLFILLIVAIGFAVFNGLKVESLKTKLVESNLQKSEMEKTITTHNELVQIDSLLLQNQYKEALHAYEDRRNEVGELEGASVELRIAVANKFVSLSDGLASRSQDLNEFSEEMNLTEAMNTTKAVRKSDSLSFVLEKTKVQLARLERQMRKTTSGKYLTFDSSKGSQIHFVGDVKDGKANGHGLALLSTGSRYEGDWKNNLRHGEGTFFWPDGEFYSGTYKNDQRSGEGTYHWPNGEKFVGLWKNDQRTGEGTFYSKEGKVISGIWEDDKLVETLKKKKNKEQSPASPGR